MITQVENSLDTYWNTLTAIVDACGKLNHHPQNPPEMRPPNNISGFSSRSCAGELAWLHLPWHFQVGKNTWKYQECPTVVELLMFFCSGINTQELGWILIDQIWKSQHWTTSWMIWMGNGAKHPDAYSKPQHEIVGSLPMLTLMTMKAFKTETPEIRRFPKSWGYPQSSSILDWDSPL